MSRKTSLVLLILVLASAAGLRVWGIWHGLPHSFYPDEAHFVKRSLSFGSGDLNPHWFHKPAFFMYFLFAEFGITFVVGKLLGFFHTVEDFAVQFFLNPFLFYFIGRITTALFGIASIGVLYLLGSRIASREVALLSALFLSISFGHVEWCHYVKADIPCTFFTLLSFFFLFLFMKGGRERNLLLFGLLAGLGMATKYYSLILLPSLLIVLFYHRNHYKISSKRFWKFLALGIGCFFLGFFAGSPFNFLDGTWFRLDILPRIRELGRSSGVLPAATFFGGQGSRNIFDYTSMIFNCTISPKGFGLLLGYGAFLGGGFLFLRHRWEDLLLLSVPLSYLFCTIAYFPYFTLEPRNIITLFPFFALFLAIFLKEISGFLRLPERKWAGPAATFLVLGPLVLLSLLKVVEGNSLKCQKDSRIIVKEYMENNPFFPSGTPLLIDNQAVPLMPSEKNVKRLLEQVRSSNWITPFTIHAERQYSYLLKAVKQYKGKTFDVTQLEHPWWASSESENGFYAKSEKDLSMGDVHRIRDIRMLGDLDQFRFIITSHYTFNQYNNEPLKYRFPSFYDFYNRELKTRWKLFLEVNTEKMLPGPVIRIYENPRYPENE